MSDNTAVQCSDTMIMQCNVKAHVNSNAHGIFLACIIRGKGVDSTPPCHSQTHGPRGMKFGMQVGIGEGYHLSNCHV